MWAFLFLLQLVLEALNANPGDKKEYWVNARTDTLGNYTSPLTPDNLNTGILIHSPPKESIHF